MKIEVNTIVEDNTRRPDYEGSFVVLEDKGDTMIIEVEDKLEELQAKIAELTETINILIDNEE